MNGRSSCTRRGVNAMLISRRCRPCNGSSAVTSTRISPKPVSTVPSLLNSSGFVHTALMSS
jgi:hypothetical protein